MDLESLSERELTELVRQIRKEINQKRRDVGRINAIRERKQVVRERNERLARAGTTPSPQTIAP